MNLTFNSIEKDCKQKGLSKETISQCLENIQDSLFRGNTRMRMLGEAICQFLKEEGKILENEKNVCNNSSDIIESTFGMYKYRKSANKLYGVTSLILFLPAYGHLSSTKNVKDMAVKKHLENVKLCQIKQWADEHLIDNLVTKRRNTLKIAV
ncbi:MAG: hypothetical protein LBL79_13945 [Prevotella sp.]|nr:hypothetical protein [Prevotella sp.]